jgi:hypothetical protein
MWHRPADRRTVGNVAASIVAPVNDVAANVATPVRKRGASLDCGTDRDSAPVRDVM